MTRVVRVFALLAVMGPLVACTDEPPRFPATVAPPGWEVINLPEGYSDLITACDRYGNRLYVDAYHSLVAVAAQDPTCKEPAR